MQKRIICADTTNRESNKAIKDTEENARRVLRIDVCSTKDKKGMIFKFDFEGSDLTRALEEGTGHPPDFIATQIQGYMRMYA